MSHARALAALRAGLATLTPETWGKGAEAGCCGMRLCAITALPDRHERAWHFLKLAIFGAKYDMYHSIAHWNDAPERTLADVHAAYQQAIALAEEADKP